jgi:hypothetical protein
VLYAMFCYNSETMVGSWPKEKESAVMAGLAAVQRPLVAQGKLGPMARLMPTTAAVTVRAGREHRIFDGPFAETKEQLLGFYVLDADSLEEAIGIGSQLVSEGGALEIRPLLTFEPGSKLG